MVLLRELFVNPDADLLAIVMKPLDHCLIYSCYLQVGTEVPLVGNLCLGQKVLQVASVEVNKTRQSVILANAISLELRQEPMVKRGNEVARRILFTQEVVQLLIK